MNGGARSSQRPKAVSKRVQNQSEILQRAANDIAFGDWLERSFWSSPSDDICLLTVCKIHTQLAEATWLFSTAVTPLGREHAMRLLERDRRAVDHRLGASQVSHRAAQPAA